MTLRQQVLAHFERLSAQELLFVTKHLAVMIKAGIPLPEALHVVGEQAHSNGARKILHTVQRDVENGITFSKALARHPHVFNSFYTTLIQVSEESGTLEKNLEFLSVQLAKSNSLQKKIQSAVLYPSLVIVSTTVMSGFISFFILPQLIGFFESFNTELPVPTKVLLAVATFIKLYGGAAVVLLLCCLMLFLVLIQNASVKLLWHKVLLQLPIVGLFIRATQMTVFSRNLGILIGSGVPVLKSLETTAQTMGNMHFQSLVLSLYSSLEKGKTIAATLKQGSYREFPLLVSSMISIGEKTGKLDESLLYLADFYEEEIDGMAKNLGTLLEPSLLLIIGLLVGFVAIAIISPIYELTGSLAR